MPLPADTDVSSPKHLRDKYAIVGVGETAEPSAGQDVATDTPSVARPQTAQRSSNRWLILVIA